MLISVGMKLTHFPERVAVEEVETGKSGVAGVCAGVEIVAAATEVEGVGTWTTSMAIDVEEEAIMDIKTVIITEIEAVGVPAGMMITTAEGEREDITTGMTMDLEEDREMVMEALLCSPTVGIMQDHHPLVHTECLPFHLQRLLPR